MQVCMDAESDSLPCKDNMVIMSYDSWSHNQLLLYCTLKLASSYFWRRKQQSQVFAHFV